MLWKIGSSLRKATLLPTGITSTCGTITFARWVIILPCAGAGRGVSPFARFNQITAPPGPSGPPPETVPLTLTVGFAGATGGDDAGRVDEAGGVDTGVVPATG